MIMIDIACLGENRVEGKEDEKIKKCLDLATEIKVLWKLKKVNVVPVVIGFLVTLSNRLETNLKEIACNLSTVLLQTSEHLESGRILRRFLAPKVTC